MTNSMSDTIIKVVDFEEYLSDIKYIRTKVFIEEQKVPVELEWDEFDRDSVHILAYSDNKAVGTARLLRDGHIGRMAVLMNFRNRGIGKNMLNFMVDLAHKKLMTNIQLSAQEHAIEFYEKNGFSISSDVYMDAGIPHYEMKYGEEK